MKCALTLSDLPGPYVELACTKCDRKGKLLRSKLIEEYGAEITLPDLRVKIAECPRYGNILDGCGVYYEELKHRAEGNEGDPGVAFDIASVPLT